MVSLAVLRLVQHDQVFEALCVLIIKARMLRAQGLVVRVLIGVIDLVMAYRQVSVDLEEAWHHGMCWVNRAFELVWAYDTRLGFGGRKSPIDFNRITRALIYAVNSCVQREGDGKARAAWAALLKADPTAKARFEDALANTVTRQMSGYRRARAAIVAERVATLEESRAAPPPAANPEPVWPWAGMDRDDDLTHAAPLRELPPAVTALRLEDTHYAAGFFDDNAACAIEVDDSGEAEGLRARMRELAEAAGFEITTQQGKPYARGEKKWAEGRCGVKVVFLGLLYDLNLDNPSVSLPPKKIAALKVLLDEIELDGGELTFRELESLGGKLAHAAQVVPRGRLYCSGLFESTARHRHGPVRLTRWLRECLRWWRDFFASGAPPCRMIAAAPTTGRMPHSDASKEGYGGWWEHEGEVYAFHGEWAADVQAAFNKVPDLHINTLELLAVDWMLQLCGPHFHDQTFVVKCDNAAAVDQLNAFKARKAATRAVLQSVDQSCAQHALEPQAEHIEGVLNRLADWLSRRQLARFEQLIRARYGLHTRIHYLQVQNLRNFSLTAELLLCAAGTSRTPTATTTAQ